MASTTVTYTRQQKKLTVIWTDVLRWPAQRQALTSYIREKSSDAESMFVRVFRKSFAQRVDVVGSNVVWADFDSGTPESWGELPSLILSLRVPRSSPLLLAT